MRTQTVLVPTLDSRVASAMKIPGFSAKSFRTGVACSPWDRAQPRRDMSQLEACPPASKCRDSLVSAKGTAIAAGVLGTILAFAPPVRMRVDALLAVTSGAAGFELLNFTINNQPQWAIGQLFHSAIFAPGADVNTAFAGDYIDPGSIVTITVNNLDGAAAQTIWLALKGPGS